MNHVITLGDVLRTAAVIAGICGILVGITIFVAGAFANPETGESDNAKCRKGVTVIVLGGIIVAAILLAGCATPTVTRTVTQVVKEPVAVQPITKDQIPAMPPPLGPRPSSLQAVADVALAGHCRDVSWIVRVFPLLQLSAGLPPSQAPAYPECRKYP